MSDKVVCVVTVLSAVVLSVTYVVAIDQHETRLSSLSTCIHDTAKAHHYTGDASGQEAYELFASSCR